MAKHINEDLKKEILIKKLNGESAYVLSKEYKVATSTIYTWFNKYRQTNINNNLIDITKIIKEELITLKINGFDILINEDNLHKLLKGSKM